MGIWDQKQYILAHSNLNKTKTLFKIKFCIGESLKTFKK